VFLLKKILAAFLLPPGLFVALLMATGIWALRRRQRSTGILALLLGFMLWGMSLGPVATYLQLGIQEGMTLPRQLHGDVIILLGGGTNDSIRDLTGVGAPSDEMMTRLVTAVRLQKRTNAPIIVSGGALLATDTPEAWIVRRFLADLGVPRNKIIIEDRSRDTVENGRYVAEICTKQGFKHPFLVTSAYHMKRALLVFQRQGLAVTPLPSDLRYDHPKKVTPYTFLPSMAALTGTSASLHERLGLLFYSWSPGGSVRDK
jgi:uncharacterized SAM-binding protein YcdF (DUF218 family)